MAEPDPDSLLQFLSSEKVDLARFYEDFRKLGVKRVQHLEDVQEQDYVKIGLTDVEIRRIKRRWEKQVSKKRGLIHNFRKLTTKKKGKQDVVEQKLKDDSYAIPTVPSPPAVSPTGHQKVATICLIRKEDLAIEEKELGRGEFSTVKRATWTRSDNGTKTSVAVKILRGRRGRWQQEDFIKEANALQEVHHDNIVQLYGIVITEPFMLVTELAPQGSLINKLREKPCRVSIYQLCTYAKQIASGMAYLEKRKLIHRDLALRNILLKSMDHVKITDFGLSRELNPESDVYLMSTNSCIPIAWTAPEALEKREFSTASDVWSYGITTWEMFSYGAEPYEGKSNLEIVRAIASPNQFRLPRPEHCPKQIWKIIYRCWEDVPANRPSFAEIVQHVTQQFPARVRAVKEYRGQTAGRGRLNIHQGEMITVIDRTPPFFVGQNENLDVGQFPSQCVAPPTSPDGKRSNQTFLSPIERSGIPLPYEKNAETLLPQTETGLPGTPPPLTPTSKHLYATMAPAPLPADVYRDPVDSGIYHIAQDPVRRRTVTEPNPSPLARPPLSKPNLDDCGETVTPAEIPDIDWLRGEFPQMSDAQFRRYIEQFGGDVKEAFRRIKVQQLLDLGLPGFSEERCLRALEHCQFKVDRAAAFLMDSDY